MHFEHTVYTVYSVYMVYMVYTVYNVYTVYMVQIRDDITFMGREDNTQNVILRILLLQFCLDKLFRDLL